MTIPSLAPQTALVQPVALHLVMSLHWLVEENYTVVKQELRAGVGQELLALGVGNAPPFTDTFDLSTLAGTAMAGAIRSAADAYGFGQPF